MQSRNRNEFLGTVQIKTFIARKEWNSEVTADQKSGFVIVRSLSFRGWQVSVRQIRCQLGDS